MFPFGVLVKFRSGQVEKVHRSLDSRGPFGCDPIGDFGQANVLRAGAGRAARQRCDRGLISGLGGGGARALTGNLDEFLLPSACTPNTGLEMSQLTRLTLGEDYIDRERSRERGREKDCHLFDG